MVKIKRSMNSRIPVGYVPYSYSIFSLEYNLCKWYAYPIYKLGQKLMFKKACFYNWINRIGIMHTPEGCIMRLSDIWRYRE